MTYGGVGLSLSIHFCYRGGRGDLNIDATIAEQAAV